MPGLFLYFCQTTTNVFYLHDINVGELYNRFSFKNEHGNCLCNGI